MWNFIFSLTQQSGNYAQNAGQVGTSYNKQFERALIKALLKLLALITVLWVVNIAGWQALNLIPFFGMTVLLIAIGFSPIALSATALAGEITRVDQIKSMPAGIPAGAQIWIAQVLPAIIVSCHILIGFLATWSFAANPIAFWYFAMACMTICSAVLAWKKMEGDFLYKLVVGYSAAVAIFALVTTQWPEAGKMLDREGRVELQQQQVAADRQAEIDQATQDVKVANAVSLAQAARHIPSSQVIDGCEQLRDVQSGLYNFVLGHPGAVNCREIEVGPNQYFDIVLDPNRSQPHCSAAYPDRRGLVYDNRPGPDRVSNTGDAFFTVVIYETPQGEDDPFGVEC